MILINNVGRVFAYVVILASINHCPTFFLLFLYSGSWRGEGLHIPRFFSKGLFINFVIHFGSYKGLSNLVWWSQLVSTISLLLTRYMPPRVPCGLHFWTFVDFIKFFLQFGLFYRCWDGLWIKVRIDDDSYCKCMYDLHCTCLLMNYLHKTEFEDNYQRIAGLSEE